jgi:hypothetical protein
MNKAVILLFLNLYFFAFSPMAVAQETATGSELGEKWSYFRSLPGNFEVQIPGDFTEKSDTVDTPVGSLIYHTAFLQLEKQDSDNLFYMVSYCDYPEETIHSDSTDLLEEFFAGTMETAAVSVRGNLVYSAPLDQDDFPGWQWRIDYLDGQVVIKTRAFVAERRYFSIQTIMYKNKSMNRSSSRFFESFRLLE